MNQQYIFELIRDNSRVIIPNFGAFLLKGKLLNSSSDNSGSLNLSFNDFLKFNDGILVDYIAQKEKVNKVEAELQVTDFVNLIKSEIEKHNKFEIENIGFLVKDDKGKIRLQSEEQPSLVEPKVKPEPKIIKKEIIVSKPARKQEVSKPKPVPVSKPKSILLTPTKKPEEISKKPTIDYTIYQKKSKSGLWVLLSVVLVALISGILYLSGSLDSVLKSDIVQNEFVEPEINDEVNSIDASDDASGNNFIADSVIADSVALTETNDSLLSDSSNNIILSDQEVEAEILEPEEINNVDYFDGKYYHLIAASYPNLKEAEAFVEKLNGEGFHSRIINKKNNHYRVSYDSYKTKGEALDKLKVVKETKNPDVWYLYYE